MAIKHDNQGGLIASVRCDDDATLWLRITPGPSHIQTLEVGGDRVFVCHVSHDQGVELYRMLYKLLDVSGRSPEFLESVADEMDRMIEVGGEYADET